MNQPEQEEELFGILPSSRNQRFWKNLGVLLGADADYLARTLEITLVGTKPLVEHAGEYFKKILVESVEWDGEILSPEAVWDQHPTKGLRLVSAPEAVKESSVSIVTSMFTDEFTQRLQSLVGLSQPKIYPELGIHILGPPDVVEMADFYFEVCAMERVADDLRNKPINAALPKHSLHLVKNTTSPC